MAIHDYPIGFYSESPTSVVWLSPGLSLGITLISQPACRGTKSPVPHQQPPHLHLDWSMHKYALVRDLVPSNSSVSLCFHQKVKGLKSRSTPTQVICLTHSVRHFSAMLVHSKASPSGAFVTQACRWVGKRTLSRIIMIIEVPIIKHKSAPCVHSPWPMIWLARSLAEETTSRCFPC